MTSNLNRCPMKLLNTELIKLGNNRFYWFALTFYILLMVLMDYAFFVVDGANSILVISNIFQIGLVINLILFVSFVVGMVSGQEFQFNSFKYELISGRTRNQKVLAGFLNLFLQTALMTALFFSLAFLYFLVVNRAFPVLELALGIILLKFFLFFLFYSFFVYGVALLTRHGIATIFISVVYFIMEFLLVQHNLLKLEEPDRLYPYLFGRSLLNMITANWQEKFWLSQVQLPLIYVLVFALISFVSIRRMQFK